MTAALGMRGDLVPADILIGSVPLSALVPIVNNSPNPPGKVHDITQGITNAQVQRTIDGASTVTLTIQDPFRSILRSGMFSLGDVMTLDGLNFALVTFAKTGGQEQIQFEAATAYDLRKKTGPLPWKSTTDLDGFAASLVAEVPGVKLVCQPGPVSFGTGSGSTASSTATSIARGTTSYPNEDSWTCMNRLGNSAGWRVFECEGTVYLGSDAWLLTEFPSAGTIREFTPVVQVIDGTYDVGMPLGQLTVAAMTDLWEYAPGQPITVAGMGPFDGLWLVYSMVRNLFDPQATITLQKAMSPEQLRLGLPTLQYV